jgi:hypothetical protein
MTAESVNSRAASEFKRVAGESARGKKTMIQEGVRRQFARNKAKAGSVIL